MNKMYNSVVSKATDDDQQDGDTEIIQQLDEALQAWTKTIVEKVAEADTDELTVDVTTAMGQEPSTNINNARYYQVRARQQGDEMVVYVCDRDGKKVGTSISPYNATVVVFTVGLAINTLQDAYVQTGFNQETQGYYEVLSNGVADKPQNAQTGITCVVVLEIRKLTGSATDVTLGEMYFNLYGGDIGSIFKAGKAIVNFINPIPKN